MEKLEWRAVQPINKRANLPSSRWGHACCSINDQIVFFGGYAESVYMNDVWVFNVQKMQWEQIKTTGDIPSSRSNCSLSYDKVNDQILLFGGGGPNRNRFNSIHSLDWKTKVWSIVNPSQTQPIPWERTYHSGQLIYPYLIVFGGQSIADMDDLWAFNLQTKEWKEIPFGKQSARPCSRRFHSSCIIGNQFFVIAGCHSKYRCICDIYSVDLTRLVETGQVENHVWKKWKNSSILRWGHTSTVFDEKIYIFGGRFCNDLNDIMVFDPKKETIKNLKVNQETIPLPRRKPCACFVGSCLIMFGGFNNQYYNDLHCINVSENRLQNNQPLAITEQNGLSFLKSSKFTDVTIETKQKNKVSFHKDIMLQYFPSKEDLDKFIKNLEGQVEENELLNLLHCVYRGYGNCTLSKEHAIILPQKKDHKNQSIKKYLENKYESFCAGKYCQKISHIELNDDDFGDFLENNRQKIVKDIKLIVNKEFIIESSRVRLSRSSSYFKNILSSKFRETKGQIQMHLPFGNIVLFEILLNYLLLDYLIVPIGMSHESWIQLYKLSDFFSLKKLQFLCIGQIHTKLSISNIEEIFTFSQEEKLEQLSQLCANFKVRNMQKNMVQIFSENVLELTEFKNDKYLKKAYNLRRFEINQKLLSKDHVIRQMMKKKSTNSTISDEKENFQVCNQ